MTIGSSEGVRRAHNSFATPNPFVSDDKLAGKEDDAYHFIAYVPVHGGLYELDGLKPAPVWLTECTEVCTLVGRGQGLLVYMRQLLRALGSSSQAC